jgi:chaperone modulatory protein CbpM
MNFQHIDPLQADSVCLSELCIACAMSAADLHELMDYGALAPLEEAQAEPHFAISYIEPLRTAGILRRDYDLDLFVVVILMDYLQRIVQLEAQLHRLQAQTYVAH